jgi:hypothetical protein
MLAAMALRQASVLRPQVLPVLDVNGMPEPSPGID